VIDSDRGGLARDGLACRPARYVYCDRETTVLRQSDSRWYSTSLYSCGNVGACDPPCQNDLISEVSCNCARDCGAARTPATALKAAVERSPSRVFHFFARRRVVSLWVLARPALWAARPRLSYSPRPPSRTVIRFRGHRRAAGSEAQRQVRKSAWPSLLSFLPQLAWGTHSELDETHHAVRRHHCSRPNKARSFPLASSRVCFRSVGRFLPARFNVV
jgi:hypothetical protein